MSAKTFVVYHKHCGHVLGVTNSRVLAQRGIDAAGVAAGTWRIRAEATDADIAAVGKGERCDVCEVKP